MSSKNELFPKCLTIKPAEFPEIPKKIEALRKIWRKEITNFLDALTLTKDILEPHLSRVLRKLESIIDAGELAIYCSPTEQGVKFTPIAQDIDIAVGEASLEIYEQYPESGSLQEAFAFMKRMYEPYRSGQFENWKQRYN